MPFSNVKNIAIIRRNGLGDLLCTVPLIQHCKALAKKASITLFVDPTNAVLLPYLKGFEHSVIFPKGNKYVSVLKTALFHRKKNFDVAISAKTSPMKLMNLCLFTLTKGLRFAPITSDSWHHKLVNCGKKYDPNESEKSHQALKGIQVIDPSITSLPKNYYPKINLPKNKNLSLFNTTLDSLPLLLISISYNRSGSNLGIDKHVSILNALHTIFPIRVVISCLPPHRHLAQLLSNKLLCPSIPFCTQSFDQFLCLLNSIDLALLGDSGTMHLTAALRKKQVALFGRTSPVEWAPLSDEADIFFHPQDVKLLPETKIIQALVRQLQTLASRNRF